jgi:hypothetical protein
MPFSYPRILNGQAITQAEHPGAQASGHELVEEVPPLVLWGGHDTRSSMG